MSAALLDQDFGSESGDDNFNPAPADESDNDAAGESDADAEVKKPSQPEETVENGRNVSFLWNRYVS